MDIPNNPDSNMGKLKSSILNNKRTTNNLSGIKAFLKNHPNSNTSSMLDNEADVGL